MALDIKINKEIRAQLDHLGWQAKAAFPLMIGVGGTARAAHKLSCALFSPPADPYEIDADCVEALLSRLKKNTDNIYSTVYKLIPERVLTINPGLMILYAAIKRFGCKKLSVCAYGAREGYYIDRVLKEAHDFGVGNAFGYKDLHAEQGVVLA